MDTTIGHRIKILREQSKLSIRALATKLDVSHAAIHHWESDKAKPTAENIFNLSKIFGRSPEWFVFGVESEANNKLDIISIARHNDQRLPLVRRIPIISWQDAKQFNYTRKTFMMMHNLNQETIPCFDDCSDEARALQIKNDMMVSSVPNSPSFSIGDYIIIDPKIEPKDGSFVLVDISAYPEAVLYQYVLIGGRPHLKPLNPQYLTHEYNESTKIIGTLAYSYKKYI